MKKFIRTIRTANVPALKVEMLYVTAGLVSIALIIDVCLLVKAMM